MREIRFSIDRDWARAAHGTDGFEGALPVTNSWGGWPSAVGVAPYLLLRIVVSGVPDPVTGFLVNIHALDRLLRRHAIPLAAKRLSSDGVGLTGENLVRAIWDAVSRQGPCQTCGTDVSPVFRHGPEARPTEGLGVDSKTAGGMGRPVSLESLALWTTPYLSYAIVAGEASMVDVTQCFEFSASHRLHVASMSDEENRRVFGKCNNPNGHGHNYRVEVTVTGEVGKESGRVVSLPAFEEVVRREVIARFDHKHLNADMPEFANLNPSVENIARTTWALLRDKVAPARLRRVKVWETAKTYAEYSGE
jgi:6-pyruvoyltetrahydropterin/6-carboxytetrahydropterin synthase